MMSYKNLLERHDMEFQIISTDNQINSTDLCVVADRMTSNNGKNVREYRKGSR